MDCAASEYTITEIHKICCNVLPEALFSSTKVFPVIQTHMYRMHTDVLGLAVVSSADVSRYPECFASKRNI